MINDSKYIPKKGIITAKCRYAEHPCLSLGKTYIVDCVIVSNSWSRIWISEFPEMTFNAASFLYYIDEEQINIVHDYRTIRKIANYPSLTTKMICRDLSPDRINQIIEECGITTRIINRLEILENHVQDAIENKVELTTETKKNMEAARLVLLGAVCGDIIGSYYESHSAKYRYDFPLFRDESRFTDDTVCSIAIADALIKKEPFGKSLHYWCRKYPRVGYGFMFKKWMKNDDAEPYNSWGNGSAMRVSPIGAYADSLDEVMELSKQSAEVTHNHPEGIKGAQATAVAIYLALHGNSKDEIKSVIESTLGYDLSRRYDDVMLRYGFDVSSQGSVPESIISFIESHDYESAVRKAIALGGDADTMGAIAGGIAAAYYGEIPQYIQEECLDRLPDKMKTVIEDFNTLLSRKHT